MNCTFVLTNFVEFAMLTRIAVLVVAYDDIV